MKGKPHMTFVLEHSNRNMDMAVMCSNVSPYVVGSCVSESQQAIVPCQTIPRSLVRGTDLPARTVVPKEVILLLSVLVSTSVLQTTSTMCQAVSHLCFELCCDNSKSIDETSVLKLVQAARSMLRLCIGMHAAFGPGCPTKVMLLVMHLQASAVPAAAGPLAAAAKTTGPASTQATAAQAARPSQVPIIEQHPVTYAL